YASGTSKYYEFGYATSTTNFNNGTVTWLGSASTTATYSVPKAEFRGTRYYTCRVYASDGTNTSGTVAGTTTTTMSLVNARLYFDAATNGGTVGTANLYVPYGQTNIYTGRTNTTAGTIPSATKTGYAFNGWYTAATGGSQVINASGVVQASVSSWTNSSKQWLRTATGDNNTSNVLYAQFGAISYTIGYTMNGGTAPSVTSGTYDADVAIAKPSKTFVVNIDANSQGASITSGGSAVTSASSAQTFAGWTASNLNTSTAKYGSAANPTTAWNGTTKVGASYDTTYFKNLRSETGTVTLVANWTAVAVTLPKIEKLGSTCGYATSAGGSITYASEGSYTPSTTSGSTTLYAKCTMNAPEAPTISGATTKIYGASAATLTCTSTATYAEGTTKYYAFGYATSDGETPGNWSADQTSATYSVATNYVGDRYYSCRVYASDGTNTTSTVTSAASGDALVKVNNAKLTFNVSSNGGSGGGTVYTKNGATGVYTGIQNTTAGSIPTATKSGWTFNGWYDAASGGNKVLNSDGTFTGTAVSEYTTATAWAATADKTLYAQFSINNPATPTITGGATKIYNYQDTTLTCASSTSYASGTSKYYEFGYATSTTNFNNGTITWLGNASTTATLTIGKTAFRTTRYYTCRVYASDGTNTSGTVAGTTTTTMSLVNARLYFDAATNGGTTATANLYVPYGQTNVYTGRTNTTAGTIPTASKSGWTFNGWYTAASGGSQVVNASGVVQASVSGWTDASKNWLRTANGNNDTSNVLYAQFSIGNPATPTISGGATKIYNYQDTTLTCATTTSYASGTSIYYEFGYSTTSGGSVTWLGSASTTATYSVTKALYRGARYYTCRVYAGDGTSTSSTVAATTTTTMSLVNARLYFDAATNGGTVGTANLYVPYGQTNIYTGRTNTTAGTIPTASKSGWTFNGWYTAASGGSQVINASGVVQASVSGWTDASKNWLRTANGDNNTSNVLYAQFSINNPATPTISGGATKIYGASATTLTCATTTTYATGTNIYYSFGYATSNGGTPGSTTWTTPSTTATTSISATAYVGQRWYSCRVYASDGTTTSSTVTSAAASDTEMTINNAKLTFNATTNGGTGGGDVYTKKDATVVYTTIRGTTTGTIPTATKSGWTLAGWYDAASGGNKVLNADGSFTGTAVSGYTSASAWAATTNKTLYAQYTIGAPATPTISGGTTKIYNYQATTLTCATTTTYASGTSIYYEFGYATSTTNFNNGTVTWLGSPSTTATYSVPKAEFRGTRYYTCRVYAGDGTSTSSTVAATTTTTMSLVNARLYFDAATNGGTTGTANLYVPYGATNIYTGRSNTTNGTIPVATKTGYTFNGWYTAASGGTLVINSSKVVQASVSSWTDASKNWLRTATGNNDTSNVLYAQFSPNNYTINYTMNGGTAPSVTSGTYDSDVVIANPGKTFTVNIDANSQGATITSGGNNVTSASSAQTFSGWTSTTLGSNAKSGTSANPTASWTGGSTTNTYFRNLVESGTVTMVANWTAVDVVLPKIEKTGYTCGFATSAGGSIAYASEASYTPSTTEGSTTLYARCTITDPGTPTISGGATKVYGASATTLTCTSSATYASGTTKYYSFGYATSDGGTPGNWGSDQTSATYSVATNYVGQRWYSCRVYASDGTNTSATSTSLTTADTLVTVNNAKLTFNATTNGGTGGGDVYTKNGVSVVYSGIRNTTTTTIPTATKTGWTLTGWYDAASSGNKVLNADGSFTGTAVSGYTTASAWAATADKTLYAQYTINNPATPTISGGTTKIYGVSATTLTCATTSTYASGTSIYYSFGYATSDGGTPGSSTWTTASTTATLSISATAYTGDRYYSCRVYAGDGTTTSGTVTSLTSADTLMRLNNATLTFDATTNGGTGGGTVYTRKNATGVYTGIRNTTAGTIPTATAPTGYTLAGWYDASSGGNKVLNADGTFTGTAVSGYTTASAWAATTNKTLYAQYTINNPATPTITGGATKIYGASATTLTCATTTTYASGTNLYYSFGYATSDGGTPGSSTWTTASTTATLSISATAYVGQRWYSCRVYASDGTSTSSTVVSATTADTAMTINNATLTFDATTNGGTGGGTVYTKTGATGVYTGIRNATAGSIPSATPANGYTMNGWYNQASGESKVLNADGSFTGTAVSGYTTASAWAATTNKTLYAQYSGITYTVGYTMNGGVKGTNGPTSGTYGSNVEVSKPSKTFTVTIDGNSQGANITLGGNAVTEASSAQTFAGWTASDLNTSTAVYGSTSNPTTSWNGTTSVGASYATTYFKNLRNTTGTVTLTANWTAVAVALPKIEKTGYTCGYATSSTGSIAYSSEGSYTPSTTTGSATLYAKCTINDPATPTISGGATKIYGASSTTLTCATTTTYASGVTKYYSFGYAESDGETPGNWTTASSTATKSISATEYVGQRWYSCRVYASDGTNTSETVTSATASDTEMTINNATLTFDATTNGGTGGGTVYTKTGATGVYTGIRNETAGTIPTAVPATGSELTGWYTLATGGDKVLNADGTFTGTAVSEYTETSAWAVTTNKTLYAQYEALCSSFTDDSWETIVYNVQTGNTSRYPVGCTKSIDLGNSIGTKNVRVANNSTPSECSTPGFSQTACGFVLEFTNLVERYNMNGTNTSEGGWPASLMRNHLNSTASTTSIINSLPDVIKNAIIDTTVVSGYEDGQSSNYTSIDKLYLLSYVEVYGSNYTYDTVTTAQTRQLDYYSKIGVTSSNYSGAIKDQSVYWWLRSPISALNEHFMYIDNNGNWGSYNAFSATPLGESPAFRLGSSFATDSWEAIVSNVQSGNTDGYYVGDEKEVDLGTLGTHTLRIANKSTPDECFGNNYSQTACGFVLEFADLIGTRAMHSSSTNKGGWPGTTMRTYVNTDIYNALPEALRNGIMSTKVISGHGSTSGETNFTTQDKLYLLSMVEVYGEDYTYDSLTTTQTRQLDYYSQIGVTASNYSGAIKKNGTTNTAWRLRSPRSNNTTYYDYINASGNRANASATTAYGVSPAFKIGIVNPSFETDSWETIVENVQNDNTDYYHVGDTKEVDLGSLGTHILRIANMSKPSDCYRQNISQTSCGFVLEFADLIGTRAMHSSATNVGGWPDTTMRTYVNTDIYNALPTVLKSAIIDTTVISGHGSTSGESNWTTTDKLYLLSSVEIYGENYDLDTVTTSYTRQLDYYRDIGVTASNYSGAIKQNGTTNTAWRLRSARSSNATYYVYITNTGNKGTASATTAYGVSPAFRLSSFNNHTAFGDDTWETISDNVISGDTSLYNVGDTKKVDMGAFGIHTLRLANKTTTSDCSTDGYSRTACGFVLEFTDIITTHVMNSSGSAYGGWPASDMRTYVNNVIYNALPSALRNVIIDTIVVSGYETNAAVQTNYVSTDKLYFLSTAEIYGQAYSSSDTVTTDYTRQLDYYANLSVTKDNNTGVVNKIAETGGRWWLRSPIARGAIGFFWATYNAGSNHSNAGSFAANVSYGVSPAFRLGIPESVSFEDDSWDTIVKLIQLDQTDTYNVGDTREIDMGTLGTHTLRIANKSTPSECSDSTFSKSACGFVLEFADIISKNYMNSTNTSIGGWNSSAMRTYVNGTIYNALPEDLKAVIISTKIASGYEKAANEEDRGGVYYSTDKLYLISYVEMYGADLVYDTLKTDITRRLDYYVSGSRIKKYNDSATSWWQRDGSTNWNNKFLYVSNTGSGLDSDGASETFGVSPLFRIG
ncbi:MAG: InlB B-repeat-containing protein, partial [Bacilli bacterium]|nr:InlB B-repeat-containing protein [Bacilli bacterium]